MYQEQVIDELLVGNTPAVDKQNTPKPKRKRKKNKEEHAAAKN